MKIENKSAKSRWISYQISGAIKKVFVPAYGFTEVSEIEDLSQINFSKLDEKRININGKNGIYKNFNYTLGVYDKTPTITWDENQFCVGKPLNLFMFSGGIGYCNGKSTGFFLSKTIDEGFNWKNAQPYPTTQTINNAYFINASSGVCTSVEGGLFITTDAANSWSTSSIPSDIINTSDLDSLHQMQGLYAASVSKILLAPTNSSLNKIYKTENGGVSWEVVSTSANTPSIISIYYITKIKFYDNNIGWVVGTNGVILKTEDGGSTWSQKGSGITTSNLFSINIVDENQCWIAGASRTIMYTKNGGTTWAKTTPATLNSSGVLYDYYVLPSNNNIQFAMSSVQNCMKSTNSGVTWSNFIPMNRNGDGLSICPISENEIYTADGDYGFFLNKITNLTSYTLISSACTYITGGKIDNFFFQAGDDGWTRLSNDYGITWNDYSNITTSDIEGCLIIDKNNIYTTENSSGKITRISNEFQTLSTKTIAGFTSSSNITVAGDGKIWAVSYAGTKKAVYTSDSGDTWTEKTGFTNSIRSMSVCGNIMVLGSLSGMSYLSLNNGDTWAEKTSLTGVTSATMSIKTINNGNIVLGTTLGRIYLSLNSGETWNMSYKNAIMGTISKIHYLPISKTLIAISVYGYILKSEDYGISWKFVAKAPTYVWGFYDLGDENSFLISGGGGSEFLIKLADEKLL